jgi:hypothetical protein
LKEVQAFLGFANFYQQFILGFSLIAKLLTELIRKLDLNALLYPLADNHLATIAFERLKAVFTRALVLAYFDPELECWLETDASDYVYAAILS